MAKISGIGIFRSLLSQLIIKGLMFFIYATTPLRSPLPESLESKGEKEKALIGFLGLYFYYREKFLTY